MRSQFNTDISEQVWAELLEYHHSWNIIIYLSLYALSGEKLPGIKSF